MQLRDCHRKENLPVVLLMDRNRCSWRKGHIAEKCLTTDQPTSARNIQCLPNESRPSSCSLPIPTDQGLSAQYLDSPKHQHQQVLVYFSVLSSQLLALSFP